MNIWRQSALIQQRAKDMLSFPEIFISSKSEILIFRDGVSSYFLLPFYHQRARSGRVLRIALNCAIPGRSVCLEAHK